MRWAVANRQVTAEIGDYYCSRVQDLAGEFRGLLVGVDGYRHMTCLRFADTRIASGFAKLLVDRGFDISAQTYKRDFPPSVLTKLPLIAGVEVVDAPRNGVVEVGFYVGRFRGLKKADNMRIDSLFQAGSQ
jgi:hypothetical protein